MDNIHNFIQRAHIQYSLWLLYVYALVEIIIAIYIYVHSYVHVYIRPATYSQLCSLARVHSAARFLVGMICVPPD